MIHTATRIRIPGPVSQDKDKARELRKSRILPALASGRLVALDFSKVTTATQSFLHACLSEAIRIHGEEILDKVSFHGCAEDIRSLIGTVVEYSLRARTLTQEGMSATLRKVDVPQADNLSLVRDALDALAIGSNALQDVEHLTGFSFRHIQYRLHAARVLGLVKLGRGIASLTLRGRALTSIPKGSTLERQHFIGAILDSKILQKLCPNLLDDGKAPSLREIARRLAQKTGLSESTSLRRAQALLAWRKSLMAVEPLFLPGF
jgi:STAS-like domain of unknown function (DUF4325)